MPKRRIACTCLALPLLYGLVPVVFGFRAGRESAAESAALIGFGVLFLLGGVAMVSSSLWLLVVLGGSRLPL